MSTPAYKSKYFVPATALMLFAAMFTFDSTGVTWFWVDQPIIAGVLLTTSALFWGLLLISRRGLASQPAE